MKGTRILFLLVTIASCSVQDNDSFKRTASGLEFRIISGGNKGAVAGSGATVKLNYTWYRGDTVWQTNRNFKPFYQALIPGVLFPYDPFETLVYGVRENDSVVVHLRVDSLLQQHRLDSLPPGTKKEDVWTVGIKVLKIFPFDPLKGDSIIRADQMAENRKFDSLHHK
jgi:hypothetical protein